MPSVDIYGGFKHRALFGKANALTQGESKIVIPCLWARDYWIAFGGLAVFFHTVSTTAHSFSFYEGAESGSGTLLGAVTVAIGQRWGTFQGAFSLKGQTDFVTVRHDTNAQDADETGGAHVADMVAIYAGLIPVQYD